MSAAFFLCWIAGQADRRQQEGPADAAAWLARSRLCEGVTEAASSRPRSRCCASRSGTHSPASA